MTKTGLSKKSRIALVAAIFIMATFLFVKAAIVADAIPPNSITKTIECACFLIFVPAFYVLISEYIRKNREEARQGAYVKKLNSILISQSHNHLFYEGNVHGGAEVLVREVANAVSADRCSIWLYSDGNESIVCEQLYMKKEDRCDDYPIKLYKKDFAPYFDALQSDSVIAADDAEQHPATKCFTESYLRPLGIKSMLDVPILYKGQMIGVICIESFGKRIWEKAEIDFAQMLSALYSFSHSIKVSNLAHASLVEMEKFIDEASIISKADKEGRITYVNKKFSEVSGWSMEEALGKDHNLVNSGFHSSEFWKEMYKVVAKERKIWNSVVTNRAKDGSLYYVDTYIKASFDDSGKLVGFTSIRQDFTDLKNKEADIRNRMDAINRSNAVIEFDLEGNIIFANDMFLETMGYAYDEIKDKKHQFFLDPIYADSEEYKAFWNSLTSGEYFRGEISRMKKDGSVVYLHATYNPIFGTDCKPYRIMKIATDTTKTVTQQMEIEKKNTYLEHSAKILRHDMHSGINTYMPRGLNSLERRLSEEQIRELKIEAPIKMIKEGLRHTQKVYRGVYEFTNLVKKDVVLNKAELDLKSILEDYLSATAYKSQVIIDDLGSEEVNEALFCTAVDNLIRNGLKYNDSATKMVKIYRKDDTLFIEDNGRGMTQEEFKFLSQPYTRKQGQKEGGTGLGLNICVAILEEHRFSIDCSKLPEGGTQLKIKMKK